MVHTFQMRAMALSVFLLGLVVCLNIFTRGAMARNVPIHCSWIHSCVILYRSVGSNVAVMALYCAYRSAKKPCAYWYSAEPSPEYMAIYSALVKRPFISSVTRSVSRVGSVFIFSKSFVQPCMASAAQSMSGLHNLIHDDVGWFIVVAFSE